MRVIAEWSLNLAITWSMVLTFMLVHFFWFSLADDEQDWGEKLAHPDGLYSDPSPMSF